MGLCPILDDVWPDRKSWSAWLCTPESGWSCRTDRGWMVPNFTGHGEKCEFHPEYSGKTQQSIRGGWVGNISKIHIRLAHPHSEVPSSQRSLAPSWAAFPLLESWIEHHTHYIFTLYSSLIVLQNDRSLFRSLLHELHHSSMIDRAHLEDRQTDIGSVAFYLGLFEARTFSFLSLKFPHG